MSATIAAVLERVAGRLVGPGAPDGVPGDTVPGDTVLVDATHDSRAVERGWLYCCVPGARFDGHDFAAAAAGQGAGALLVERELAIDRPQILVPDVRAAMGPAAAAVHGDPATELIIVGVTGTNGKSSIVQLLADLWSQVGIRAEIIGTLVGARTTPEAPDLQRALRQAVERRVQAMAIEVSSHALALHRVAGVRFALGIFTNLTQDHLDFHPTMEDYFEAKARLFTPAMTERGVVNVDDPHGRRLLERATIPTVGYGLADAEDLRFEGATSRFVWRGHEIALKLAGAHNVSNALGAARAAELLGMDPADIADALCATSPVRGRFEAVDAGQPFHIAVDYAHTPDALRAALAAARQVTGEGRVIVVFGCGGDRDVEKRADMGRVAVEAADLVVVTNDNPRSEQPEAIIADILEGVDPGKRDGGPDSPLRVEPDRQEAIRLAIDAAQAGDLVLIAGKGHETHQIIGDRTIDFDDRRAALVALGVLA
jgi:UDP-N-acetylmuramoyl-L-alanyl-D-glutamate--2,6-diaminopimelate ligase